MTTPTFRGLRPARVRPSEGIGDCYREPSAKLGFSIVLGRRSQRAASFRLVACAAGLNPKEWTPRELRHGFVSLLSSSRVTIEEIAHLVGHGSTSVTERVYRKELRLVMTRGSARHQRALQWRRQVIGRHSLADRSTNPGAKRAPKLENKSLTRGISCGRYWI